MPPVEDHAQLASDAELITRVRAGDRSAFGDLYSRHAGAALALARQFSRSSAEADDLVSEAFARVLDGMLESKGPDTAFRAYLFTTLRNTAYDRTRKDKRLQFSDDMESHDVAVESDDPVIADLEKGLIGKAFAGLPERWQTVLWHLQVEGQSAAEVGVLLGMAPNAVSSLAFRAREGLREAYLQAHLAETAAERCRTTVDRLGAWTRGGLSKREKAQVDAHLEECDRCPVLAAELSEINTGLRGLLAPLLLGGAAAGYLATLGPVVPLAQLGVLTGGKAAAGLGGKAALGGKGIAAGGKGIAGHAAAGLARIGSFGPGAVAAGVAAAAAIVVAGVAIALSGGHSAPPAAGAGSGVATAVTSGPVAGGGGTATGGSGGNSGSNGGGGNGGGGSGGGNSGGSTGTGAAGAPGASGGSSSSPTTNAPVSTGPSGANPSGAPGVGTTPGIPGIVSTATTPLTPTAPVTPTAPISEGNAGTSTAPTNAPVTSAPTDIAGSTDTTTSDPTTPVASTGSTSPPTETTTAPPTTAPPTTAPPTTAPPSTTAPPTTAPPTTTAPPPPAAVIGVDVGGTTVSPNLSVGGPGQLSLQIANTGNAPSDAGATMQMTVPAGVTLGQPVLSQALRSGAGAFSAALAPQTCSAAADSTMTCTLPSIDGGKTLTLTFDITADPTAAASSAIDVTFPGGESTPITVKVGTGYGAVSVTSADELGRASTGVATVKAAPSVVGTDAGTLAFPLAIAPGITITGLDPGTLPATDTGCTIDADSLICPSGAAATGVDVLVAVGKQAGTGALTTAPATDQGGRALPTGSLTVSTSGHGGYTDDNPVELDPVGVLAPGTTTTIVLVGHPLPGVVDPGPIVIPVDLTAGSGVTIDVTNLPTGCVVTPATTAPDSTVTCSPADNAGSATFELPIDIAPTTSGGPLNPAVLPFPGPTTAFPQGEPTSISVGGTTGPGSLPVDPTASGYRQITARVDGLDAGADGSLTLVGTPTTGISSPGTITLPTDLGSGVKITGVVSGNCTPTGDNIVCTPATKSGSTTWELTLRTDSQAVQGTLSLPKVSLPGKGMLALTPDHTDLQIRAAATICPASVVLTNGNFGAPVVPDGAGTDVLNSATTVWQTTAPDHQIEYWRTGGNSTSENNGVAITGQAGTKQWVELNGNYASALYQDVVTIPGHELRWTIWHRARATSVRNGQDVMQVQIGVPGTIGSVTDPGSATDVTTISDGPSAWVQHTGSYLVPPGQTTTRFQFAAVSSSNGNPTFGNFLDSVSIDSGPCLNTSTTVTNVTTGAAGASTAKPGDVLLYDTTVTNTGTETGSNLTLTGPAPANTTEVSRTPVTDHLDAGATSHITLTVTVDADVPDSTVISDNAVVTYQWPPTTTLLTSVSNSVTTSATTRK